MSTKEKEDELIAILLILSVDNVVEVPSTGWQKVHSKFSHNLLFGRKFQQLPETCA